MREDESMKAPHTDRNAECRLRGQSGFTLAEVMLVAAVSVAVVLSIVVAYVGTVRSWGGTTGLLEIQREASLGMEIIAKAVRPASDLIVATGVHGDSLLVYYPVASGDSLGAEFYLDGTGNMLDINGVAVATGIDSMSFVLSGNTLNIDSWHRSDAGTPNRATDDQRVQISTTAICRN